MLKNRVRLIVNIGYVMVWKPDHHRAETAGAYAGYVYEHVIVAERVIGRKLRLSEQVHHLDFNKVNNSPANLLVVHDSQHAKLHMWIESLGLKPKKHKRYTYADNKRLPEVLSACPRCAYCGMPMGNSLYCDIRCQRKYEALHIQGTLELKPSKTKVLKLLARYSWCAVGRKYGVSDNAVRKWVRAWGLDPKTLR